MALTIRPIFASVARLITCSGDGSACPASLPSMSLGNVSVFLMSFVRTQLKLEGNERSRRRSIALRFAMTDEYCDVAMMCVYQDK